MWIASGDKRLSKTALGALIDPDNSLFLSAVNAWEYADLEKRGRFNGAGALQPLIEKLDIQTLDLPASIWASAAELPDIHRDPIDRMMIAHAQSRELCVVSADRNVRRYPIKTLW